METFTQPKITGYRQLNETEAALMNNIKALGQEQVVPLLKMIGEYLEAQEQNAPKLDIESRARSIGETGTEGPDSPEQRRLWDAQPKRWAAIARTHFQEGLMALTRAVAQPGSF